MHTFFFLPGGGIPLYQSVRALGFPEKRMHALEISGSAGTQTGRAEIKQDIPKELLDIKNIILIPEDMGDSYITIFRFIMARSLARDPSSKNAEFLYTLLKELQLAHDNHNKDAVAYQFLVDVASKENVVLKPVWSKNEQVSQKIKEIAYSWFSPFTEWKSIQQALLKKAPIKEYPYDKWTVGANIMDTAILAQTVRQALHPQFRDDPRITRFIGEPDENDKLQQWLARAALISPLAYLDPSKNHEKNIINLMAYFTERSLSVSQV